MKNYVIFFELKKVSVSISRKEINQSDEKLELWKEKINNFGNIEIFLCSILCLKRKHNCLLH